jgi:hypothetical protein
MPFPSIEDVAPRVVKGIGETIHVDNFTPTTGVAKHRGCFVRWRVRSGSNPVLDTIRLAHNTGWNPVEVVGGEGNYSNRAFGIIGSYPEKINDIDGGGVYGRLTVHVLGGKVPVLVAFRYINDNGLIAEPSVGLIGKRVWVYGLNVNVGETTHTVAMVADLPIADRPSFVVRDVIRPLPLVRNMPTHPRDMGWVVVALDSNFLVDGAIAP